jgi:hypothetical protein
LALWQLWTIHDRIWGESRGKDQSSLAAASSWTDGTFLVEKVCYTQAILWGRVGSTGGRS